MKTHVFKVLASKLEKVKKARMRNDTSAIEIALVYFRSFATEALPRHALIDEGASTDYCIVIDYWDPFIGEDTSVRVYPSFTDYVTIRVDTPHANQLRKNEIKNIFYRALTEAVEI